MFVYDCVVCVGIWKVVDVWLFVVCLLMMIVVVFGFGCIGFIVVCGCCVLGFCVVVVDLYVVFDVVCEVGCEFVEILDVVV